MTKPTPSIYPTKRKLLIRKTIIQALISKGYVILPLINNTKRPHIRWKKYIETPPTVITMDMWFKQFPNAEIGLLTTNDSGIICLDCDAPPYPTYGFYTKTPSGGRHYWYKKQLTDLHSLNVSVSKDVPWIIKIYAMPFINEGRIPVTITPLATTNLSPVLLATDLPFNNYQHCSFINWFNKKKYLPWDNRYGYARAYASNVANSDANKEQRSLGPNYLLQDDIYATTSKPLTCKYIVHSGYKCPFYNKPLNCCNHNMKSTSPYGLANYRSTDNAN